MNNFDIELRNLFDYNICPECEEELEDGYKCDTCGSLYHDWCAWDMYDKFFALRAKGLCPNCENLK